MRVLALVLALAATASAFVPPMPARSPVATNKEPAATVARLSPLDVADVLVAAADAAADAEYEYGAVAAPGWVLPLGAILTLGTAIAVPLFLRPGTEAFEEEKRMLEEMKQGRRPGQQDEE